MSDLLNRACLIIFAEDFFHVNNGSFLMPRSLFLFLFLFSIQIITGAQGYHVLECMQAFLDSSAVGRAQPIASTFARPAPLPQGLPEDALD